MQSIFSQLSAGPYKKQAGEHLPRMLLFMGRFPPYGPGVRIINFEILLSQFLTGNKECQKNWVPLRLCYFLERKELLANQWQAAVQTTYNFDSKSLQNHRVKYSDTPKSELFWVPISDRKKCPKSEQKCLVFWTLCQPRLFQIHKRNFKYIYNGLDQHLVQPSSDFRSIVRQPK